MSDIATSDDIQEEEKPLTENLFFYIGIFATVFGSLLLLLFCVMSIQKADLAKKQTAIIELHQSKSKNKSVTNDNEMQPSSKPFTGEDEEIFRISNAHAEQPKTRFLRKPTVSAVKTEKRQDQIVQEMYGSPASMKRARTIAPPRKSSVNEQALMATLPSMRDSHATMRVDT